MATVPSFATANVADVAAIEVFVPLQGTGDFLYFAVVFFLLAILAAAVGARGVAGVTMTVAKWFVIIFIILAVISLLL